MKLFSAIPKEILEPYLYQIVKNSINETDALTGPIIRGDQETIDKHLQIIEMDFIPIYNSFLKCINNRRK